MGIEDKGTGLVSEGAEGFLEGVTNGVRTEG